MFEDDMHVYVAGKLEPLRGRSAELKTSEIEAAHYDVADQERQAAVRGESSGRTMVLMAGGCAGRLNAFAQTGQDALMLTRMFQMDRGVYRDVIYPDKLMTAFLLTICWLLEGIFTTIGLFADGHADLIAAMGFAATFSTVNVGLGLAVGFCLRYIWYRIRSAVPHREDIYIRSMAITGVICLLLLEALMITVAGRVRVSGKHDGVLDFTEISFAATFNDGLALVVMIIAGLSCAMAVAKGYSGFGDPEPGYANFVGNKAAQIHNEAEALVEATLDDIEALYEDAEDDLLDILEDPDDVSELIAAKHKLNADIENAKQDVIARTQAQWQRQCFVAGHQLPEPTINLDGFDALLLEIGETETTMPKRQALDQLREVHADAVAMLTEAHAEYLARSQQHLPPVS